MQVALHDMRQLKKPLHMFEHHNEEVFQVRTFVWDLFLLSPSPLVSLVYLPGLIGTVWCMSRSLQKGQRTLNMMPETCVLTCPSEMGTNDAGAPAASLMREPTSLADIQIKLSRTVSRACSTVGRLGVDARIRTVLQSVAHPKTLS